MVKAIYSFKQSKPTLHSRGGFTFGGSFIIVPDSVEYLFYFLPILSGLIEISVYSCGELRKTSSERKIDMKKLVIILTIAIMLFATEEQRTEQSSKVTEETLLNAGMEQTEKVPETNAEQLEKTTEVIYEPMQTESKVTTKEDTAMQTPMKECTEEHGDLKVAESEETVQHVDKGNQSLAEYKSQPSGQPNPFENAPHTEIVDQPVEDLIGEGEDHPGEGKHF